MTAPSARSGPNRWVRFAVASVVAVGGTGTVFGLMLLMNGLSSAPEKPESERSEKFVVAPKPKPPPKRQRPKPKPKPREQSAPKAAPPPSIDSAIGSVGIDLPGFAPSEMQDVSKKLLGDVRASVMTADSVDVKPQCTRRVQPELPPRLVQQQVEGEVVLKALINARGEVEQVRVVRSEPKGVFDGPAREALEQWQCQPARYKGEAVKMWTEVPFRFELG